MLLALLLLACSGAVDPVDSVVDTSDTGEPIGCCMMECADDGSGSKLEGPEVTLESCEALGAGNCMDYTVSEC